MEISYSKISLWKQCRKAYDWTYRRRLDPLITPTYFTLGRAIHESLAKFYSYDPSERSLDILVNELNTSMDMQWRDSLATKAPEKSDVKAFDTNRKNGRIMIDKYWGKYGIDEGIPKAKTETRLEVVVGVQSPTGMIMFVGRPDALLPKWLLEHKTGNPDLQSLALEDEQSLYYCWAMKKLGEPVLGTLYNIIPSLSAGKKAEMERLEIERTDNELDRVEGEILQVAKEIASSPRYPTRGWICKNCQYRILCRAEAMGADVEYLIEQNYKVVE